jgi:hypothetical protein
MINLCESEIIGNECFAGSSCLLLGSEVEKSKKDACRYWGRKPFPLSELGSFSQDDVPLLLDHSAYNVLLLPKILH